MSTRIKVCGVRDRASMQACMDAGVDYVGLNFAPGSRRSIDVEQARELAAMAADSPTRMVGVFRDAPVRLVLRIAERVGLDLVQLHGRETPNDCTRAAEHLPVIKALPAGDFLLKARMYEGCVEHLLVDGCNPGSGEVWDYATLPPGIGVFLAGGLRVDNVPRAIAQVRPFAVDTASGVERDGEPDPALVHAFAHAVRTGYAVDCLEVGVG